MQRRAAAGLIALVGACGSSETPPRADGAAPADGAPVEEAIPAVSCSALPPLPWEFRLVSGPPISEDFTFDEQGYLLALSKNNLVRVARGGAPQLVASAVALNGTGVRVLPGGDFVVGDEVRGTVQRIDAAGGRRNIGTNIRGPNGIQLGPGGQVYVTGLNDGNLYRVDPTAGLTWLVAFVVDDADGIAFANDHQAVFVNSFNSGEIFRLPLMPDGSAGAPVKFAEGLGHPDGMTIDECGNLYVAGYGDGKLRRVGPDGKVELVADFQVSPVTAVNFGSGKQGWDARAIYVMNYMAGGVFELRAGVRGGPQPP
jgi:sugar lactone lactonase YvrE